MLSQVEALARVRGCGMIDLSTFSFQAPAFYRKHGFVELFAMDIPSRGIKKHFLQKLLDKI